MPKELNYLDKQEEFEILYSQAENEQVMSALQYEVDQINDHFTSYFE